jgi:membrane associated rhomboid family serine protease
MVSAAVGFQCPECVQAGRRMQREARTVLGGKPTASTSVTSAIIGLSLLAFVGQMSVGISASAIQFGMSPSGIALADEWWRLLTAAFLHGGVLHIAFNMYILWIVGQQLERILGHSRFLALYLVSAVGGSVASYAFSAFHTVSVGASGAVFGLMGALVITGRRLRFDVSQIVVLIGLNTVIGFVVPGIDWRAHMGGLLTGAVIALIYARAPRRRRSTWQWSGVVAVFITVMAVAGWRTTQILTMTGF